MPLTLARHGPAVVFRRLAPVAPRVRSSTAVEFNVTRRVSSLSRPNPYRPVVGSKLPKVVFPRTGLNGFSSSSAAAAASTTTTKKTSGKKKRGRRALTEKQKEAKARRERTEDIKELKKIALKDEEPKPKSVNPWSLYISSRLKAEPTSKPSERLKQLRDDFKNLSPEEREVYEREAQVNKEANESFYKAWVQSHSPLRIKEANSARLRLKLLTKDRKRPIKLSKIKDDRQVPRPLTPFMQFSKERRASGDFKHLAAGDILKQLAREWAAMTPEDKKKYEDEAKNAYEEYRVKYKATYGQDPPAREAEEEEAAI
ncbi:hypothetical protein VTN31DRAFT_3281 [Thermomyces dupontii]|uniref:uncharacterized protein n=1 Tax=Talaromyces thermophilus TaxID=28565 RepID=UPI0037441728